MFFKYPVLIWRATQDMHEETVRFGAFAVFGAATVMACAVVLLASLWRLLLPKFVQSRV
jgi:hypothetical protein